MEIIHKQQPLSFEKFYNNRRTSIKINEKKNWGKKDRVCEKIIQIEKGQLLPKERY